MQQVVSIENGAVLLQSHQMHQRTNNTFSESSCLQGYLLIVPYAYATILNETL